MHDASELTFTTVCSISVTAIGLLSMRRNNTCKSETHLMCTLFSYV